MNSFLHPSYALLILSQLLAISSIHSLVISHRDIKPENILITPSGNICLADFGLTQTSLSRSAHRSIARFRLNSTAGTPAYWAPEVDGPDVKTKGFLAGPTDMWSFGIVLGEMIFGGLDVFDSCFSLELM